MPATVLDAIPLSPPMALPSDAHTDPRRQLMFLESQLSALMDSKDVPGWTVNPAYHPDVTGFIYSNAYHAVFFKKALSLQKNRASYFARVCKHHTARRTVLASSGNTALDTAACYGRGTY